MSFEWSDYLALARDLYQEGLTHSSKEAELRSSISRAYYAAFCKARNHLRDKNRVEFSGNLDIHKEVREIFLESTNRTSKEIGENLNRLRQHRNRADYKDNVQRIGDTTKFSVELADDILSDLRKL